MTEADKLYELALALRAKATPGEWEYAIDTDWHRKDQVIRSTPAHSKWVVVRCEENDMGRSERDEADFKCIVAAVNLLDALPKLRAEWEREARRAALEEAAKICDGLENEFDMPGGVSAAGARKINRAAREIRALQQPAAQAEEERT